MKRLKRIISAPKRFLLSRLRKGTVVAKMVSIEDGPPMGDYKIAKADLPDYEHLEIYAGRNIWK